MGRVLIALGANVAGGWGTPSQTFDRAIRTLSVLGIVVDRASPRYHTRPMGSVRQPEFLNGLVLAEAPLPPAAILRLLKRIERCAGRRVRQPFSPRPLDLDLLDFAGRVVGWPSVDRRQLILPHPEMHRRAFVLVPLLDIAPNWRHPIFGVSAKLLLKRLGGQRGAVRRP